MSALAPMNALPRRRLRELMGRQRDELLNDPRRTRAMLMDLCGEHKREINVLIAAQEERVASDLLNASPAIPKSVLLDQLTRRLHENRGLDTEFARWAVESWALALGVISSADVSANASQATASRPSTIPNDVYTMPRVTPRTARGPFNFGQYRGQLLTAALHALLTLGPWAVQSVKFSIRILRIMRNVFQSLFEPDWRMVVRATLIAFGGALVAASLWAVGGGVAGAIYGLLTAATSESASAPMSQSITDWTISGAGVGATLGAMFGALLGVIRYYGENGGVILGALVGVSIGIIVGPMTSSSFFLVGALTAAIFSLVSIAMIGGQGKNIFALVAQAMGMAGATLRKSAGWSTLGKGILIGGIGSVITLLIVFVIGFRGTVATALVGMMVGMTSGAIVGDKYKWLRLL